MEQLVIRSNRQIFEDIVVTGLKEHVSKEDIRASLIEAFRKEIFGQMMFRMKVEDLRDAPRTQKNEEIVIKISEQARKKWHGLMRMCNQYKETWDMIKEHDLDHIFDDEEEEEIDEMTAEWPELSEEESENEAVELAEETQEAAGSLAEGAHGEAEEAESPDSNPSGTPVCGRSAIC